MQRRQQPRARFHQDDARAACVGNTEVARDDIHRELLDRARQLHPGRTAADDDEGQVGLALGRIRLGLRALEGAQQPRTDERGFLHILHPRREGAPVIVTEIVIDRPRGEDQVVVLHRPAVGGQTAARKVDRAHLGEHDVRIPLGSQDGAHRLGDIRRRQRGRGDLVQQRLKEVIVVAVDDQHVRRSAPQRLGGEQSAEPAPDNDDPYPTGAVQTAPPPSAQDQIWG